MVSIVSYRPTLHGVVLVLLIAVVLLNLTVSFKSDHLNISLLFKPYHSHCTLDQRLSIIIGDYNIIIIDGNYVQFLSFNDPAWEDWISEILPLHCASSDHMWNLTLMLQNSCNPHMPSHYPPKDDKQMLNVCTALAVVKKNNIYIYIYCRDHIFTVRLIWSWGGSFFFLFLIYHPFTSSLTPGVSFKYRGHQHHQLSISFSFSLHEQKNQ